MFPDYPQQIPEQVLSTANIQMLANIEHILFRKMLPAKKMSQPKDHACLVPRCPGPSDKPFFTNTMIVTDCSRMGALQLIHTVRLQVCVCVCVW